MADSNRRQQRGASEGGRWNPLCIVVLADGLPAGSFPVAAPLLPDELVSGNESKKPGPETRPDLRLYVVGATGFEPVTSSVSAKSREPLCSEPFSQVGSDRRGARETLS
jgi:hypothetical protein